MMNAIEGIKSRVVGLLEVLLIEPKRIVSEDRDILEKIILPYFGEQEFYQKILFVGCSAYTQWYEQIFSAKEYWTIDSKSIKRKFGSRRHIVDSVTNIENHFGQNYFDLIIMNGVIGFGLNQVDDIETALTSCYQCLNTAGVLVLGWNDDRKHMPIDLMAIQALQKWHEYYFVPLRTCHVRTGGRHSHVFSFYTKGRGRGPGLAAEVGKEQRSMEARPC
jgi:hypothetical protein